MLISFSQNRGSRFVVAALVGLAVGQCVPAQSLTNYAVRVSAEVQTNPPRIELWWPADTNAANYTIYRKLASEVNWDAGTSLAAIATNYLETNILSGGTIEYHIHKVGLADGDGYILAGIEVPLAEFRGKVVLVVDSSFTTLLSNELARLEQDLAGDGWTVLRHDVPRMAVDPANASSAVWAARANEVANVKALINADYDADPVNLRSVFLLGHVPVPYSGDIYPDQHSNHRGAWPADAFYGDMDGVWPDAGVNRITASDARNRNVPGDGKLDRSTIPSDVELQVGRVDFANLPAFSVSETELLRRYLNKDHAFRHKLVTAEPRGLIDDHLGLGTSEPLAANGWRNFAPLFEASNTIAGDWLTTLSTQSYLWGYGCGGGTYTTCSGVATTSQLATNDPRVVFSMLFGSYFGDWDSHDNLLRAAIATTNYTLTSAWVGRPFWYLHHMALGETIGFSTRLSQNNDGFLGYWGVGLNRMVHIALMGDPTLRMHIVAPPSALMANTNGSGQIILSWSPSPEAVIGYHLYRAPNLKGPFIRVNSALITGTNYTDPLVTRCTYMVRAVKLEVSGSGSYFNASQGIFQDFDAPSARPLLVIAARNVYKVYGQPVPQLTATYSGFVYGDTAADLDSPAVLSTSATATSPPGSYPITVRGAADTDYVITFLDGWLTNQLAATAISLTSSQNPSPPGQAVIFTATVNAIPPAAGTPTGTLQFKINGTNAGAPALLSGGLASYTTSALPLGWHWVEVLYAGDENFAKSSSFLFPDQLVNTAPVAGADVIERDPTNSTSVFITNLLSNDSDPDHDSVNLTEVVTNSGAGGTVSNNSDRVFYTPPVGFTNADTLIYTIADDWGSSATGMVTVKILGASIPSPKLDLMTGTNGSHLLWGDGIPGGMYRIQAAWDLTSSAWQTIGSTAADSSGVFQFVDSTNSPARFYRSVYP